MMDNLGMRSSLSIRLGQAVLLGMSMLSILLRRLGQYVLTKELQVFGEIQATGTSCISSNNDRSHEVFTPPPPHTHTHTLDSGPQTEHESLNNNIIVQ